MAGERTKNNKMAWFKTKKELEFDKNVTEVILWEKAKETRMKELKGKYQLLKTELLALEFGPYSAVTKSLDKKNEERLKEIRSELKEIGKELEGLNKKVARKE